METDAPAVVLDLLLDAHDGWLDDGSPEVNPGVNPELSPGVNPEGTGRAGTSDGTTRPVELPDAPRRRHRH